MTHLVPLLTRLPKIGRRYGSFVHLLLDTRYGISPKDLEELIRILMIEEIEPLTIRHTGAINRLTSFIEMDFNEFTLCDPM